MVKPANRQYSSSPHDFELNLQKKTEISAATDESPVKYPKMFYNFKSLEQLKNQKDKTPIGNVV